MTNNAIFDVQHRGAILDSSQQRMLDWLQAGPWLHREHWWRAYFHGHLDYHLTSSSFVESAVASSKHKKLGVSARQSVADSQAVMVLKDVTRNKFSTTKATRQLDTRDVAVENALLDVNKVMCDVPFEKVKKKWEKRLKLTLQYVGTEAGPDGSEVLIFEVKRKPKRAQPYDDPSEPWPVFDHVRIVRVQGGRVLCSCGWFESELLPCEHCLALKQEVQIGDFHIRHTKRYQSGALVVGRTHRDGAPGPCAPPLDRLTALTAVLSHESWKAPANSVFGPLSRLRGGPVEVKAAQPEGGAQSDVPLSPDDDPGHSDAAADQSGDAENLSAGDSSHSPHLSGTDPDLSEAHSGTHSIPLPVTTQPPPRDSDAFARYAERACST
jgi:hypothetical protein